MSAGNPYDKLYGDHLAVISPRLCSNSLHKDGQVKTEKINLQDIHNTLIPPNTGSQYVSYVPLFQYQKLISLRMTSCVLDKSLVDSTCSCILQ
jgi:hypothetical protein